LDAALRSLAENFSQRTGIEVKYGSELSGRRLRDVAETHLFRIAQEALTNVARHSEATAVEMELVPRGENVMLAIRDNGHGFETAERRSSPGLGLAGMETRARGCGGTLMIESAPGKGLKIEVTCPNG
jgi:signal transduction histidine kinase